ncbi:Rha family transcriptional regulator [Bacillus thuringiensis]|uniref:Rha family transcriptional regulator n=1 Tax=Bacillus thuringiensis TaxID=1428 RepID=UPI003EC13502
MSKLTVANEQPTLSSLEVGEMVGKEHKGLLRDIRTYISYLDGEEMSAKLRPTNYFIESSYKDSLNRTKLCYHITKKGCELIAHKMTGKKGTLFSASYIERFHEMETLLQKPKQPKPRKKPINLIFRQEMDMAKTLASVTGVKEGIAFAVAIERAEKKTGEDFGSYKRLLPTATHETGFLNTFYDEVQEDSK